MIRWRRTAALLVLTALLTGCWDVREMNQLALVMAVGVDKGDEPGRYRVTVQIARPGSAGGKGGGGGGGGGQGAEPVYTASADGDTIFAAIRNLAQFTSRRIMWAHNNVIVIGEEVARDDISPVIDFFTRNQELRMRTWVVVAKGTDAKSIVSAKTGMEQIPADSISALFRYAQLPGESLTTDMNEVAAAYFSPDLHPVIAAMSLRERAVPAADSQGEHGGAVQAELRGTALFQGNRLTGYIRQDAGRGLLWLRQEMRNAAVTIPCPENRPGKIAIEVRSPEVRISTAIRQGSPVFQVNIRAQGWLMEQDCPTNQMQILDLKDYAESAFAQEIQNQVEATLRVLQGELRTDAVKFGRLLHVQQPVWWRQNRERWNELFPDVTVQVNVRTGIPKMGLYTRPLKSHWP